MSAAVTQLLWFEVLCDIQNFYSDMVRRGSAIFRIAKVMWPEGLCDIPDCKSDVVRGALRYLGLPSNIKFSSVSSGMFTLGSSQVEPQLARMATWTPSWDQVKSDHKLWSSQVAPQVGVSSSCTNTSDQVKLDPNLESCQIGT